MSVDARIAELGITLPEPAAPVANYVTAVITGNLLFVSGQLPYAVDGSALVATGKVGQLAQEHQPDHPPVTDMWRGWAGAAPRVEMSKWCRSGLIRIAWSSAAARFASGASERSAARKSTRSPPPRQG